MYFVMLLSVVLTYTVLSYWCARGCNVGRSLWGGRASPVVLQGHVICCSGR